MPDLSVDLTEKVNVESPTSGSRSEGEVISELEGFSILRVWMTFVPVHFELLKSSNISPLVNVPLTLNLGCGSDPLDFSPSLNLSFKSEVVVSKVYSTPFVHFPGVPSSSMPRA